MKYSLLFLNLYIALSWITHTVGSFIGIGVAGNASNPIARMTLGDLCGMAGIVLFLIIGKDKKIFIPQTIRYAFMFSLLLAPGILVTPKPFKVFFEIFVVTFMILLLTLMVDLYKTKKHFLKLLRLIVYTSFVASLVGFWDLIAGFTSLPHIFEPRWYELDGTKLSKGLVGEAKSGFRNAGQAGTYFMMMIAIMAPLKFSKLKEYLSRKERKVLNISLTLSIIFLVSTAKIAALLGLVVALPLYAILFRKKTLMLSLVGFVALVLLIAPNLELIAPQFYNRFNRKLQTRVLYYVLDEYSDLKPKDSESFIESNYKLAYKAFLDNPLTGSGLGGFGGGIYDKHEVHSTPMKLLGETGILGILGYAIFMSLFLFHFVKAWNFSRLNPYRDYLINMIPFVIGCFINWGYSFHMRKRPFWFIVTIVVLAYTLMKEWEKQQKPVLIN